MAGGAHAARLALWLLDVEGNMADTEADDNRHEDLDLVGHRCEHEEVAEGGLGGKCAAHHNMECTRVRLQVRARCKFASPDPRQQLCQEG